MDPRQLPLMAIERLAASVLSIGAVLFLPAGSFRYWEAWVFMAVLFIPMTIFGTYLLRHHPALLERRMKMWEREPQQKRIVAVSLAALAATFLLVQVEQRQQVVTTGPYAVIRHPLYAASILIYGASPLARGSYWALLPVALIPALLVARIRNEEQVLRRDLEGYGDYCGTVRYRLGPGSW